MNNENVNAVVQLVSSIDIASKELEKSLKSGNAEKFKKIKEEMLKFQKQINDLL